MLVHVIDCANLESQRDPLADLKVIESELEQYGGLADRPRLIALNKIDVPDAREMADMVAPILREQGYPVFEISAVTHEGLRELSFAMAARVQAARDAQGEVEVPRIVIRPAAVDDAGFTVTAEGDAFRVRGERPERWVRQTDFSNDEAVGYLADRLARLGVEEELAKAGAVPGSEVRVGPEDNAVVFDWYPTLGDGFHQGPRGTDIRLEGRFDA